LVARLILGYKRKGGRILDNKENTVEVTRESIKLTRVDVIEEIKKFKENGISYPPNMKLVNIRGTNGSGKSTVPLQMLANDRATFMLTHKGQEIATVFPTYGFVALGKYRTKTGGLDGIRTTQDMKDILALVHFLPYSIIMEGILASTVYSTYAELFETYKEKAPKREVIVFNIIPEFDVIKERVLKRNGNKEVKWEQLESKWRTVKKNAGKFREAGFKSLEVDNSGIQIEDTLDWFFDLIDYKQGE